MSKQCHYNSFQVAHALGHILGNVFYNIIGHRQSVLCSSHLEHSTAQFHVGLIKLNCHAPLETRDETWNHTIQFRRTTVARHDELFLVLMQMVENVEECVLSCSLASKFLNVVKNENINALIEADKLINLVLLNGTGVLHLKDARCGIKNPSARTQFLDSNTYGLDKMSFTHASGTKDKHWIESLAVRILGNSFTHTHCQLVASATTVVLKGVTRIKLRVDVIEFNLFKWICNLLWLLVDFAI